MQIEFVDDAPTVLFRLTDVEPPIAAVLPAADWEQFGDVWQRSYPADAPHIDRIMSYFFANAERMFRQVAGLDPVPWEDAIVAFAERARVAGIDWWLTGSGAAAIRGTGIVPHDLDIMFDPAQRELVLSTFGDVLIQPLIDTEGWVTRYFGVLFLHAQIDIAADPDPAFDDPEPSDFGPFAAAHLETVSWNGWSVRVPPLYLQEAVNRRRGRLDRASLIERALANRG